nr:TIGR00730 family Rossman fold protein [Chelatococcus reniformis]
MKSVCVYCGSGTGRHPDFMEAARTLGRRMAEQGLALVYGGGNIGLMGEIARSVIDHGGHVTGIIPEFLKAREVMLQDAQETVVVADMHTRKRMMYERADAFVALPGGIGTLEELIEQLTWAQLGQHSKPILVLNTRGFWRPLLVLVEHMRDNGFIRPGLEVSYGVVDDVEDVIPALKAQANGMAYAGREGRTDPLIGQRF